MTRIVPVQRRQEGIQKQDLVEQVSKLKSAGRLSEVSDETLVDLAEKIALFLQRTAKVKATALRKVVAAAKKVRVEERLGMEIPSYSDKIAGVRLCLAQTAAVNPALKNIYEFIRPLTDTVKDSKDFAKFAMFMEALLSFLKLNE